MNRVDGPYDVGADDPYPGLARGGFIYPPPSPTRLEQERDLLYQEIDRADRRGDQLRGRLQRVEEKLRKLPPEPPRQSVVRFDRKFAGNPKVYSYVAVRIDDRWFLSGREERDPMHWSELVQFAKRGTIRRATGWAGVPQQW